jgi:hypothetical protein
MGANIHTRHVPCNNCIQRGSGVLLFPGGFNISENIDENYIFVTCIDVKKNNPPLFKIDCKYQANLGLFYCDPAISPKQLTRRCAAAMLSSICMILHGNEMCSSQAGPRIEATTSIS